MWFGMSRAYGASGIVVPSFGTSGSDFDLQGSGTSPTQITLNTQATGSSLVVMLGGFLTGQFGTPTYNGTSVGAPIQSSVYAADKWAGYGLQLHALASISGGSGHVLSATKSTPANESTMIAVEVASGGVIASSVLTPVAQSGADLIAGVQYTSGTVTVAAPATLVAFWSGDGGLTVTDQSVVASGPWTMRESLFLGSTAYLQAACWTRDVAAGTYSITVTPAQNQGCLLGIVAVTKGP